MNNYVPGFSNYLESLALAEQPSMEGSYGLPFDPTYYMPPAAQPVAAEPYYGEPSYSLPAEQPVAAEPFIGGLSAPTPGGPDWADSDVGMRPHRRQETTWACTF